jgi:hypothetical protein
MSKIGRNEPCPCGSGRKYKKCCGDPRVQHSIRAVPRLFPLAQDPKLQASRLEARELIRKQQQGLGRPISSVKLGDATVVAVGNTVHHSKGWRFFTDFLSDYLKRTIGTEWGNAEIAKPLPKRHPILQWYDAYCRFQRTHEKQPDGAYTGTATGVVYCYLGLAYNLYLLDHNVELQAKLVNRLKEAKQFQGAYYELIIANCLIRAGFELALENENDPRAKHCEFSATSKETRKRYWIEAKMRGVSGMLGKTDADGAAQTSKPTGKLSTHLREALAKPATGERLIFIDVNARSEAPAGATPRWIEAAERQLSDRERAGKESDRAYVFVTSLPFHWNLSGAVREIAVLAYGLGIADFSKPGSYRLSEIWMRKQKHIDAWHILDAFRSYPNLPTTFDGSLPLSGSSAKNHIEIGRTYIFEDLDNESMVGEVTAATISEAERKLYVAVMGADGRSHILSRVITEEELASYKAHPEAYFGVIRPVSKQLNDPYELFEWMVDCHKNTPRERLLELCAGQPDYEWLAKLDRMDLVLQLCERWTASVANQSKSKSSERKS